MKTIPFYLLFFIPIVIYAQEITTKTKDFNADGKTDTLKTFYEGANGFGGKYCEIINGINKEKYEVNTRSCFCQIKNLVIIPAALKKKENRLFVEIIKKELLPKKKESADPSLQWIINANNSSHKLPNKIFFDLILNPKVEWIKGKIKLPEMYYIDAKEDIFSKLNTSGSKSTANATKNKQGWLIYYGHNHYRNTTGDSLSLVDSSPSYKLYKTSHALLIKKEHDHAWMFVSDYDLTGGPEKLRWESIEKAQIVDNYIIVQQSLAPDISSNIFIIDIQTGICGKLKDSFSEEEIKTEEQIQHFRIEDETITICNEGTLKKFPLKEIFRELKL